MILDFKVFCFNCEGCIQYNFRLFRLLIIFPYDYTHPNTQTSPSSRSRPRKQATNGNQNKLEPQQQLQQPRAPSNIKSRKGKARVNLFDKLIIKQARWGREDTKGGGVVQKGQNTQTPPPQIRTAQSPQFASKQRCGLCVTPSTKYKAEGSRRKRHREISRQVKTNIIHTYIHTHPHIHTYIFIIFKVSGKYTHVCTSVIRQM